ncbi:hypothetical protein A1O3_10108 [Capronia epimyces CBS 606.96]|uniref:Uncharacterized protein n=1 Tax=Capronia epimyces CBS 606.96 TaxID=1182542 RepID=W9XJ12_9EURO|nr:uncharacterized protein A1O3_10108 [Capronia epimyces CBS 606.96]EXJ76951.1 hypothetical protein A1O3_10108 [Capronia epimyces CBS 606.96]
MSYTTEFQVVANALGEYTECHICDHEFLREANGSHPCDCEGKDPECDFCDQAFLWIANASHLCDCEPESEPCDCEEGHFTYCDCDANIEHHICPRSGPFVPNWGLEGQLIAVWKPTPGNVAMVTDDTIKNMEAAVAQSPLYCPLFHSLSLEIRQMIWEEVMATTATVNLMPFRLCPHVDGLQVKCLFPDDSETTDDSSASLLLVSKMVQMEVLGVLLSKKVVRVFNDHEPLPEPMNESARGGTRLKKIGFGYMGPAGWDVLMSTFRPFCHRIQQMKLYTFRDAGFFDTRLLSRELVQSIKDGHATVRKVKKDGHVTEFRLCPQSRLIKLDLVSIFSSLQSLEIELTDFRWSDARRIMPRYPPEEDFVDESESEEDESSEDEAEDTDEDDEEEDEDADEDGEEGDEEVKDDEDQVDEE